MAGSDLRVLRPRCEYLVDPLGIDERLPRLSWEVGEGRRGARQVAYRIRCADSAGGLARGAANLWDSGRVKGGDSAQIPYGAAPLGSRAACHWRVQVWDDAGATAHSAPALWSVGLLEPSDWTSRWIAADPEVIRRDPGAVEPTSTEPGTPVWFRKEFRLERRPRRAMIYASARGLFELSLGGRRVGDEVLAPGWTDYHRRIPYRTYDVTNRVAAGRNVIGAVLGDGWWSGFVGWQERRGRYGSLENSLLVQLEIEGEDGKRRVVGTDASWTCGTGPLLASDFMMGESYDARRERAGWDRPGFRAAGWLPAREVAPPQAPLVALRAEPIRVTEILEPVSAREISPGVHIFDLAQNIAGWVRLTVNLPAGTRLKLRHGERLNPDGTLYVENLRRAAATDHYVCRGGGAEVWEPRFTFHGFQYVELTGLPAAPAQGTVRGCAVHSAFQAAGSFTCSHRGVNRLWLNAAWSQRGNSIGIPTDCPQRDERLGWTGDAQVFLRTAVYNRDVAAFYSKWMDDVADAQTQEGVFPDVAPRIREGGDFVGLDGLAGAAGWADAGVLVPWTLWRVYGDRRILERHWGAMTAWMDYLERTNPDGLRTRELGNNYGDWLCIPADTTFRTHSPMKNLLATAYWADDAAKMARIAGVLGRDGPEARFQAMFERVRAAFQKEFLRDGGRLAVEEQTAYVLALAFNLLPARARPQAARRLVADIEAHGWHLSTGFIGISHLNPVLTLAGRADVAYRLLLQEDYPSWLYPVRHGATTIWERWNGWTAEEGFFNPQMNSFNHYSLGSVCEWLYRHVAGIELDPLEPGFKRILLRPWPDARLGFAKASYHSIRGEIASEWRLAGGRLEWSVRVPANTTARVCVPSEPRTRVTEGGLPLAKSPLIRAARREGRFFACDVPAGEYRFSSVWSG